MGNACCRSKKEDINISQPFKTERIFSNTNPEAISPPKPSTTKFIS